MSSRVYKHGVHSYSSSYLMGSNLSYTQDQNHNSNSEYGTTPKSMGSGASSNYESSKDTNKFKRRSLSNILGRQSPTPGRPLPKGPGPLLPSSGLRKGRKKTDVTPSQAKGPVKGNHLLAKGGSHNVPRTEVSSPEEHRSLSRLKSRSLDDVRNVEKRESIKLTPDKISIGLDMKKARKAFKISRSPSFDNINTARRQTESDQRALLDRLSKMSTDEASKNAENSVKNRKSLSGQHSTSSISKDNIYSPLKNLHSKSLIQSKPEACIDNGGTSSIPRKDSLGRNRINSQEQSLQRRSSDSAYESNSSTGSSSGNSSPKMSRDQVKRKRISSFIDVRFQLLLKYQLLIKVIHIYQELLLEQPYLLSNPYLNISSHFLFDFDNGKNENKKEIVLRASQNQNIISFSFIYI